jgi:hypothetical protein
MRRLGVWLEAFLLINLGALMIMLAGSEGFWVLLNPRFRILVGITGLVLAMLGCFHGLGGSGRPGAFRTLALATFLGLAGIAVSDVVEPRVPALFEDPEVNRHPARLVHDGQEYVALNTGELYALLDLGKIPAERVVARGIVKRAASLPADEAVLTRTIVYCCFADAMGAGVVLRGEEVAGLADGEWVRVFGRPVPASVAVDPKEIARPGVMVSLVEDEHVLAVDAVEPIEPPKVGFIFEIRDAEPFAY